MSKGLTALVIGNSEYVHSGILKNPVNDANDVAEKLRAGGFTVILRTNCSNVEMDQAVKDFKVSLQCNNVGLFFFAGHGMQIDGENYLAAINTDTSGEDEAKYSSLPLNRVIDVMEKAPNTTSIIILDACRDNPFERAWRRSPAARGLAPVYAPRGTLIAYATSPGQTASDGRGRNGAYTTALLQHIDTPDCSIESMFKRVRNSLSAATKQKQISWEHTSLAGEFFFNLSLGMRIDIYSPTALSDSLFIVDELKLTHRVIRALKSLTWPTQNPAINGLTAEAADKGSIDSLFVLGRNIYQAACGSSGGAGGYIRDFMARTAGMRNEKRKALLDGMLIEIFFGADGKLRKKPKLSFFNEVFALQQNPVLSSSFDFIAECLLPHASRFHVLPGKRQSIAMDAITDAATARNTHVLLDVHYAGKSIFWLEDDDYEVEAGEEMPTKLMEIAKAEDLISTQAIVPKNLLSINYLNFTKTGNEKISFPRGYTAAKE